MSSIGNNHTDLADVFLRQCVRFCHFFIVANLIKSKEKVIKWKDQQTVEAKEANEKND